jgi:hypothetical protein
MFVMVQASLFSRAPYRWRTWLRQRLPFWAIDLDIAKKGADCETLGARHEWYNADGESSACYHCRRTATGELWIIRDADVMLEPPFH